MKKNDGQFEMRDDKVSKGFVDYQNKLSKVADKFKADLKEQFGLDVEIMPTYSPQQNTIGLTLWRALDDGNERTVMLELPSVDVVLEVPTPMDKMGDIKPEEDQ